MSFMQHNKRMLATYTRDSGKQLRVAQLDDRNKILRVFKNRYQAAKYLLDNNLSTYNHPRGIGYTRACIAGSLTNLMCLNDINYGYRWKLISPYDHSVKITEEFVHGRINQKVHTTYHRWLVIEPNSKKSYYF